MHDDRRLPPLLSAVALLSASSLSLEVALARVFSVMLSNQFVFAVLSVALLGLAAGSLLLPRFERLMPHLQPSGGAAATGVAVAGSLAGLLALPPALARAPLSVTFAAAALCAALPYVTLGLTTTAIFRRRAARSSLVYGADLAGAAAGALLAVPVLNAVGATGACLCSALLAALAAVLLSVSERGRPAVGPIALLASLLALLFASVSGLRLEVPFASDPGKDILRVPEATLVGSRWSSFGRTDLVVDPRMPGEMALYVDGAAGSTMYDLEGVLDDPVRSAELAASLTELTELSLLRPEERDDAVVIGAGGGRDVVAALLAGVGTIVAVEVNPDVVAFVREYERYSGGIYSALPQISVRIDEGRRYLRSSSARWDLIILALPVTKSSRGIQGLALTESYLYSAEALGEYLDRLTPEGRLLLVAHHRLELDRLVDLALDAFRSRGEPASSAVLHLSVMSPGANPVLVIKREPFDPTEVDLRFARLQALGADQGPFYLPRLAESVAWNDPKLEGPAYAMVDRRLLGIERGEPVPAPRVPPATDDRPFFYQFEPGIPAPLPHIVLLAGAGLVALLTGALLTLRSTRAGRQVYAGVVAASLLGCAFMLLEIALFQKLMLYLGRPHLTLTVLLFSLLLGAGGGSLVSSRCHRRLALAAALCCAAVAAAVAVVAALIGPAVGDARHPALVAPLLLVPLGALMGMPFPLCLRLLGASGERRAVPLAWGANGIASVVGSTLAMVVGMLAGFSRAIGLGALLYLFAAAVFALWVRERQ